MYSFKQGNKLIICLYLKDSNVNFMLLAKSLFYIYSSKNEEFITAHYLNIHIIIYVWKINYNKYEKKTYCDFLFDNPKMNVYEIKK